MIYIDTQDMVFCVDFPSDRCYTDAIVSKGRDLGVSSNKKRWRKGRLYTD